MYVFVYLCVCLCICLCMCVCLCACSCLIIAFVRYRKKAWGERIHLTTDGWMNGVYNEWENVWIWHSYGRPSARPSPDNFSPHPRQLFQAVICAAFEDAPRDTSPVSPWRWSENFASQDSNLSLLRYTKFLTSASAYFVILCRRLTGVRLFNVHMSDRSVNYFDILLHRYCLKECISFTSVPYQNELYHFHIPSF